MNARLVRPPIAEAPTFTWDSGARRVLSAPGGFLRVLGGPGTGKTTLLASAATRRIAEGADPESVLVLTTSRKAADALRADITRSLTADPDLARPLPRTVREPLVRTVHSYAYSLLRLEAMGAELPAPRLLAGAEQDVVVRELLAGDLDEGAENWPEQLRPALIVPGFAEEVRDLLMRAAERGLGPADLAELGRRRGREEWLAAGLFWAQYEEVTQLQEPAATRWASRARPPSTPPSWSPPRCSRWRTTTSCANGSARACGTCSSTTPTTSTRCRPAWSG